MDKLIAKWLLRPSLSEEERRWRVAATEGWVSTIVNVFLAALKGFASFVSGSVALLADAFHSLSDVITSVIIIVSYHVAKRPSDERHPFGHGRAEQTAGLVVAILLIVAGFELGKSAVGRVLDPRPIDASAWVLAIVVLTILAKELLARFSNVLARTIDSRALQADTWHHRTDAISSFLVLVALVSSRFGFPHADGLVGMLVALFVIYMGAKIAKESMSELLGHAPEDSLVEKIKGIALEHPEVLDAHDVIVHNYGRKRIVSLHIGLSEKTSFDRSHDIAEQVEARMNERLGAHTTVHVDPMSDGEELKQIRAALEEYAQRNHWLLSFHDLRLVRNEKGGEDLWLDLVVSADLQGEHARRAAISLVSYLKQTFPRLGNVEVQMEPPFAR